MVLEGFKVMVESEVLDLKIIVNEVLGFSFNIGKFLVVIILFYLKVF